MVKYTKEANMHAEESFDEIPAKVWKTLIGKMMVLSMAEIFRPKTETQKQICSSSPRRLWEALNTTGESINQTVKGQTSYHVKTAHSTRQSKSMQDTGLPKWGIIPVTKRVEQIRNLNPPTKRKVLRQFTRVVNYLRDIFLSKVSYLWSIKSTKLCV